MLEGDLRRRLDMLQYMYGLKLEIYLIPPDSAIMEIELSKELATF
jgi:hypothetical protein